MLAEAPNTCYLHEPFKPGWKPAEIFTRIDTWFAYLDEHDAGVHEAELARTIEGHFDWRRHWIIKPSPAQALDASRRWASCTLNRLRQVRPIVKDPIALFSAPWMASRFNMDVIVMLRHPAAFVSSIKLKKWWFNFEHWKRQPRLLAGPLAPMANDIERLARRNDDIIEQAILQWRAFHHVIRTYQHEHPEWQFVRHEDLSRSPERGFEALYRKAGLNFTERCRHVVLNSSDEKNITDANSAGKSTHFTNLNSRDNIRNWERRLSSDEINRIRDGTADVAEHFYGDADW
jgi:hypothetical protein